MGGIRQIQLSFGRHHHGSNHGHLIAMQSYFKFIRVTPAPAVSVSNAVPEIPGAPVRAAAVLLAYAWRAGQPSTALLLVTVLTTMPGRVAQMLNGYAWGLQAR